MILSYTANGGKGTCMISHFLNLPSLCVDYVTTQLQPKVLFYKSITRAWAFNL